MFHCYLSRSLWHHILGFRCIGNAFESHSTKQIEWPNWNGKKVQNSLWLFLIHWKILLPTIEHRGYMCVYVNVRLFISSKASSGQTFRENLNNKVCMCRKRSEVIEHNELAQKRNCTDWKLKSHTNYRARHSWRVAMDFLLTEREDAGRKMTMLIVLVVLLLHLLCCFKFFFCSGLAFSCHFITVNYVR